MPRKEGEVGFFDSSSKKEKKAKKAPSKEIKNQQSVERSNLFSALNDSDPVPLKDKNTEPKLTVLDFFVH